jgi:predicted peptidase
LPVLFSKEPYNAHEAFILVPQCREGKRWVEVDWGAKKSSRMTPDPSPMLAMAMALLQKTIEDNPVDQSQILLAGISMGGYGVWELTARKPDLFAGVLAVCGGGDEKNAPLLAKTPFWVWHGLDDKVVWPQRSQSMVEALRAAGGIVKFTELPGVGHDSWTKAFAPESGAVEWLFQQRR